MEGESRTDASGTGPPGVHAAASADIRVRGGAYRDAAPWRVDRRASHNRLRSVEPAVEAKKQTAADNGPVVGSWRKRSFSEEA